MLVNAEFRRDMQQNLLVLKDQEICNNSFQEKMLEYNKLEGFLPIRIQHMNGERMLYYDLCGIQPLSEVCHVTLPNVTRLTSLVQGILQAIKITEEYLLKEDDILLSLEYMFIQLPDYQVKLCYYPGYQVSIKKQLSLFFEALMSCVDYEDRDAVYLMYALYMKSKDESCTVMDLEQLLYCNDKLEAGSRIKPMRSIETEGSGNGSFEKSQMPNNVQSQPFIEQSIMQASSKSQMNSSVQAPLQPQLIVSTQAQLQPQLNLSVQAPSKSQVNASVQAPSKSQVNASVQAPSKSQVNASVQAPSKSQVNASVQAQLQPQLNVSTQVQLQPQLLLERHIKEQYINQEVPLAMSASIMPSELGIGQKVVSKKEVNKEGVNKGNVFRPLISNHREEEKEVLFYPSNCYLFGGLVAVLAVFVFAIILKSNILFDPVLKRLEPIKLIAALCIVLLPAFYGMKVIFNPGRKVSKFVSVGQYELKEIAATKEAMEYEVPKRKVTANMDPENNQKSVNVGTSDWINQEYGIHESENINQNNWEEEISSENEMQTSQNDKKSVSDNRTMLLNGVQASPFAQLISEHPEKADTITLVECPFYIGTVKNQMNYSLSCPVISRYHAKIEKLEGIFYISDLSSTNGTFVNGKRLKAEEPNVLIAGDKVAFANICFIFACPNCK